MLDGLAALALLDEIGYKPSEGQLELRMQDAFKEIDLNYVEKSDHAEEDGLEFDFGVLANWENGKGLLWWWGQLMAEAMKRMPEKMFMDWQSSDRQCRRPECLCRSYAAE